MFPGSLPPYHLLLGLEPQEKHTWPRFDGGGVVHAARTRFNTVWRHTVTDRHI